MVKLAGRIDVGGDEDGGEPESPTHEEMESQQQVSFVYPYGATLNVNKPAVPILSTGHISYPLNRPVVAMAIYGPDGQPSESPSAGRICVCGSAAMFDDTFLDKEDNKKVFDVLLAWSMKTSDVKLDPIDAEDPDISDYHHLPDTEALAERTRACLQESDELPRDFSKLFNNDLFKFDTNLIPEALGLYKQLGIKHEPLTLIQVLSLLLGLASPSLPLPLSISLSLSLLA